MLGKLLSLLLFIFLIAHTQNALCQGKVDLVKVDGTSVNIYTPPNYALDKKYQVVYFNDGQMLFGHPSMSMSLQGTLDSLIYNKHIEPLLVVGVAADRLRTEKYVPYQDDRFERLPDGSSYADYYAKYLVEKVIPYVDTRYSTITQPEGRAIFGFSFGGLNALWMMFNYPEVFSMSAGLSASFWVDDFAMFNEAKKYQSGQKVWFDVGTAEWNYYVPFQKLLSENGAKVNQEVFYSEVPYGLHNMKDWKERIEMPFLVFAGLKSQEIAKMEVEIEIIPSQSTPGKKFTRLNPIVTCKNGLVYSLAHEAKYDVLNPDAGKVYEEGRFELFGSENLEVIVSYMEFKKKIKIRAKLLEN